MEKFRYEVYFEMDIDLETMGCVVTDVGYEYKHVDSGIVLDKNNKVILESLKEEFIKNMSS